MFDISIAPSFRAATIRHYVDLRESRTTEKHLDSESNKVDNQRANVLCVESPSISGDQFKVKTSTVVKTSFNSSLSFIAVSFVWALQLAPANLLSVQAQTSGNPKVEKKAQLIARPSRCKYLSLSQSMRKQTHFS